MPPFHGGMSGGEGRAAASVGMIEIERTAKGFSAYLDERGREKKGSVSTLYVCDRQSLAKKGQGRNTRHTTSLGKGISGERSATVRVIIETSLTADDAAS